jgi:hypothetical protein
MMVAADWIMEMDRIYDELPTRYKDVLDAILDDKKVLLTLALILAGHDPSDLWINEEGANVPPPCSSLGG